MMWIPQLCENLSAELIAVRRRIGPTRGDFAEPIARRRGDGSIFQRTQGKQSHDEPIVLRTCCSFSKPSARVQPSRRGDLPPRGLFEERNDGFRQLVPSLTRHGAERNYLILARPQLFGQRGDP